MTRINKHDSNFITENACARHRCGDQINRGAWCCPIISGGQIARIYNKMPTSWLHVSQPQWRVMIFHGNYGDIARELVKRLRRNRRRSKNSYILFWPDRFVLNIIIAVAVFGPYFVPTDGGIACLSNPCLYGLCVDDVNRQVIYYVSELRFI